MKVSALGPEGTYSSHAARQLVPEAELLLASSNSQAIHNVSVGAAQRGVVPIENSIGGVVTASLDGLFTHGLTIVDERVFDIHHTLAGLEQPEDSAAVKRILSHPQGLAQCARYLGTHYPDAEYVSMNSTAEGMRVIAESEDRTALAIGPDPAAEQYGLAKVALAIEDEPDNETRFVTFSKETTSDKEQDFTMIAVVPDVDKVGIVHEITGVFKDHDVNMIGLDSRPMRGTPGIGSYMFYMRLDMKSHDPRYAEVAKHVGALGHQVIRMSA